MRSQDFRPASDNDNDTANHLDDLPGEVAGSSISFTAAARGLSFAANESGQQALDAGPGDKDARECPSESPGALADRKPDDECHASEQRHDTEEPSGGSIVGGRMNEELLNLQEKQDAGRNEPEKRKKRHSIPECVAPSLFLCLGLMLLPGAASPVMSGLLLASIAGCVFVLSSQVRERRADARQ